jgi:hypothetical protein
MLPLQHSKEYQVQLNNEIFIPIRIQGIDCLKEEITKIIRANPELNLSIDFSLLKEKKKQVRRYDTPSKLLSKNNLRMTLEQRHSNVIVKSKLKLKYDCMDQDLCFDTNEAEKSLVYPKKQHKNHAKIKLEADIHQNYEKYALSCSIKYDQAIHLGTLADAEDYFKRIDHLKHANLNDKLIVISDFVEYEYENILLKLGGNTIEASLNIRYSPKNLSLPTRVEFSFKIKRGSDNWDYALLVQSSRFYAQLLMMNINFWKGKTEPFNFITPIKQT